MLSSVSACTVLVFGSDWTICLPAETSDRAIGVLNTILALHVDAVSEVAALEVTRRSFMSWAKTRSIREMDHGVKILAR